MTALRVYAKVNLALEVVGRRPDGYHTLRTVMQSVALWDEVSVALTGTPGVRLDCGAPGVPADRRNTAYRAAEAALAGTPFGANISLVKGIPVEAGLGGSSADAAAVLLALERLLAEAGVDRTPLAPLAASLGADVPFGMVGGTCLCEGVGEIVTPLPPLPPAWFVIVKPPFGVSTPSAFAAYDGLDPQPHVCVDPLLAAVRAGHLAGVGAALGNALEPAVARHEIADIRAALLGCGALGASMSGSGSAVFGLFAARGDAEAASARVGQYGRVWVAAGADRAAEFHK